MRQTIPDSASHEGPAGHGGARRLSPPFSPGGLLLRWGLIIGVWGAATCAAADTLPAPPPTLNCASCHTCPNPTDAQPCLLPCPTLTESHATSPHQLGEAPDSVVLDQIADLYQPVHFNHKRHAGMSQMGLGCTTCHHYSPPGRIPPCTECHGGQTNPANLRQPSLKGAYHRQCLSCHREWSHDTRCVLCHIPQPGKAMARPATDSTDIMGLSHPAVTEPGIRVYQTPYNDGPVVTFHHKEHIELFGLRCVDCHQQENCGRCHDLVPKTQPAKTQEEIHAVCSGCHAQDRCAKCHDQAERPAFTHASTGWPLNSHHRDLDCRACHPTGRRIGRLNPRCGSCHGGWTQENFSHALVGLRLDETHSTLECTDCHAERQYDAAPTCANCHDDGRTAKDRPPGQFIRAGH